VELLLGVVLVAGAGVRAAAVVSAVLMLAFVVGIASAWARGLRIDCGCIGAGSELVAGQDPIYGIELVRDAALAVLAVLLVRWPAARLAIDGLLAARPTTKESC
jgi:uncharacterized membrane protein YphA (DoxX/SURF4 family)